jgi:hypothetical protein
MLACVNYGTLTYHDHGKGRVSGERRLLPRQAMAAMECNALRPLVAAFGLFNDGRSSTRSGRLGQAETDRSRVRSWLKIS